MVLRVTPTPTWFPTNGLYTPIDNKLLHFISSVCHLWGEILLSHGHITDKIFPQQYLRLN